MKHFLLLCSFTLTTAVFGQAYISPQLIEKAERSNAPLLVLVTFHQQLNVDSLKQVWTLENTPLATRPEILITELERISRGPQQELLQHLDEAHYDYEVYRALKIVNMISLHISPQAIFKIAEHPSVRSVVADESNFTLVTPVAMEPAAARSIDGHEPGLAVIGAPQMWALGYTGRGRTAYSIDTGIWPDHPAIKNQWKGNRLPLAETWMPWDRLTPGDKASSHGTHTTGTILGLDTATNDTIGVAFNAAFIAADIVVSDLSQVRPISDFALAFEWSLNPDGDLSTSDDVPDAINNSWGRVPGEGAQYCDEDIAQVFEVLELVGIANVSSAGNEGPGPQTMTIPHNISINEVNTFTVGSVNGHVESLLISNFSSRGPGMCGGDGSLLIKPEVVAPGEMVRSAINQDEYASYSGTSMACPHTVGAVLLLKEAFPYLPGSTLLEALYYAATDLGEEGEDNTYGMGIINVFEAYNLLINEGHEPVAPHSSPYDLVVTEIISPLNEATCQPEITPEVRVKNAGTDTIYGFDLFYGVIGEPFIEFNYEDLLSPGVEITLSLPVFSLPFAGNIEFMVRAEMHQDVQELNDFNNQIISRFALKEIVAVPFLETFEETHFNGAHWHFYDPDNKRPWELYTSAGADNSQHSARMNLYSYSPRQSQKDDLIGPRVQLSDEESLFLTFDVAYSKRNGPPLIDDTLEVWIGSACGLEELELVYRKGGAELSTYPVNSHNFVPDMADQWRTETIDLNDFLDQDVIIPIFRTINRMGNNVYIDNVYISSDGVPQSVADHSDFNAVLYPNPTSGTVHIQLSSNSRSGPTVVSLFDATGRHFKTATYLNVDNHITMDVSDAQAGLYLVQVRQQQHVQVLQLMVR